jgi:AraC-like DNA-binding protein
MSERGNLIKVWRLPDFPQLELRKGSSVSRPVPRHWHEEYQLCLIESGSGELSYRGAVLPTPASSLFIVHPGEVHSNRAHGLAGCSYRDMFVGAELMRWVAAEVTGKEMGLPFFRADVIYDRSVIRHYLKLHHALEHPSSKLEQQALLLNLLSCAIIRFSERRGTLPCFGPERQAIRRACDYLREHHAENISLAKLARIAALSPFHFSRLFSAECGMPPHQFQTLVRVSRAKALLRDGWTIPQAASQTGFFDQSHLHRHFKRVVGVTPGQYRVNSKNVQDAPIELP